MEILVVTGMSGAGKSIIVDALEDMGYFCVDNLPPKLIVTFSKILSQAETYQKVAIVTDIRSSNNFEDIVTYLDYLRDEGYSYKLFFVDANDNTLIRRYKETRRVHPLLNENAGSLSKSISQEREILSPLLSIADYYLDTTSLKAAECKKRVERMLNKNSEHRLNIQCLSFGFKYGVPMDGDLVFDVRCLPNPFYEPDLKYMTGLDKPVCDFIMKYEEATTLRDKFFDLIDYLIPLYNREGKSQLTIAFGCTGGKHRSVCFAELMNEHLNNNGLNVNISHRDISK